ncbi:MAG TPA: hypothetical protein VKA68_09260, partial [bacterium]|nr:hypothetical protein [bacterium]
STPFSLLLAYVFSVFVGGLMLLVSAGGVLLPEMYRDSAFVLPQIFGQDLVSLILGVPLLIVSLIYAIQGSYKGRILWMGSIGYALYTSATYLFGLAYNQYFLLYVVFFSFSLFTFIAGLMHLDMTALSKQFTGDFPVKSLAAYFFLAGILILVLRLGEIIPALIEGDLPRSILLSEATTNVAYAIDLSVLVPLLFLSANWIWYRTAHGYVMSGILLVLALLSGLATLTGFLCMFRNDQPLVMGQVVFFGLFTIFALLLLIHYAQCIEPAAEEE